MHAVLLEEAEGLLHIHAPGVRSTMWIILMALVQASVSMQPLHP